MPEGTSPEMLVVLDGHPSSAAGLDFSQRYSVRALALASWAASTADVVAEVQASVASEPSVSEALRTAAQRQIGFVALRRDFAEPQQLLGELLVATAQHAEDGIPGFAVLLGEGDGRPVRRILAIADQRSGAMSGLSALMAVAVADRTGAQLDVLVLGSREPSAVSDEIELLAVDREQELFDQAVQRAKDRSVALSWLPATDVADPWLVITDQLGQHEYDLVIDDLGQVRLGGRLGLERTLAGALSPGEVGDIPLRLLTEVRVPLLLVIDEIRLGIAPASVLKAGTVAALALGMIAPTAALMTPTAAVAASGPDQGDPVADLVGELEDALGVQDAQREQERSDDAEGSSRDSGSATGRAAAGQPAAVAPSTASETAATQEAKAEEEKRGGQDPKPPKAPKGGADPADLAKARRHAAAAKEAVAKDKAKKAKAQDTLATAEEQLDAAREQAEAALVELTVASEAQSQAQVAAEALRGATPTEPTVLPPQPTPEQAMAATALELSAQERVEAAVATGEEALAALAEAEEALAAAEEKVATRTAALAEAKVEYAHSKEKVDVYRASLAKSRQSPVAKGDYRLTARFGQHGGYWSGGIHTGLDFAGSSGTAIRAASSGTVVETGWAGAYGNRVVIDHGNGYQTTYNHLSGTNVSVGQKVTAGDRVGSMGSTGNSTGSHLHFEVTKGGKFIDPEGWLGW